VRASGKKPTPAWSGAEGTAEGEAGRAGGRG